MLPLSMELLELIWGGGALIAESQGWSFTKLCMLTALYGGGAKQYFYSNSNVSTKIKEDNAYKDKIQEFKDEYNKTGKKYFTSSLAFNEGDLYMSIHNANITARIQEDGNMKVTIDDEYDFTQMWNIVEFYKKGGLHKALGAAANDYGTFLQAFGLLKPFHIYIYTYEWVGIKKGNTKESSPIEKFVSVAESQIGYHEGNNNNTKYGAWYGLNYNPWCAMFVSWCAGQVGILDSVVPRYCYCPYGVNAYQSAGRYASRNSGYVPKRGDVIFYQKGGVSSHTGIVTGVDGNIVNTVEGNTSDMVARRSHYMNDTYILGYGISSGSCSFSSITMLSMGSKGEAVRHLQNLLISKGYSCGVAGADGDFGQGTYNAVVRFQRDHGLDADGIVGPATWATLNENSNSTSATGMLRLGDNGDSVKNLQNLLINKGYSCGVAGADGDFGQGTYNAVVRFQRDHGLDADGIVGPATWATLNGSINCNELLKIGSKGEAVKRLQNSLISKGYSCGATGADGDFGQGTYNAVVRFQQDSGLSVDGIVGPATWAALGNITNSSASLLKVGSKGENVVILQKLLISKGYSCGATGADGDFGQGTYNAVCAFQQQNGLSVDGVVGPATWAKLQGTNGIACDLLKTGDKGQDVKDLQLFLINAGYSCGATGADGDFGQGTYNAVCAFQRDHGLDVDGIVGPATWYALGVRYV